MKNLHNMQYCTLNPWNERCEPGVSLNISSSIPDYRSKTSFIATSSEELLQRLDEGTKSNTVLQSARQVSSCSDETSLWSSEHRFLPYFPNTSLWTMNGLNEYKRQELAGLAYWKRFLWAYTEAIQMDWLRAITVGKDESWPAQGILCSLRCVTGDYVGIVRDCGKFGITTSRKLEQYMVGVVLKPLEDKFRAFQHNKMFEWEEHIRLYRYCLEYPNDLDCIGTMKSSCLGDGWDRLEIVWNEGHIE